MSKRVKKALSSWINLNKVLMKMTEEELKNALDEEQKAEAPRQQHLMLLHRRYSKLKTQRERDALIGGGHA